MPSVGDLPSGRFRVQWRDSSGRKVSAGRSFPTEKSAERYGLDREAEVRAGTDRDPTLGKIRLEEWAERWFEARVAEPRTLSKDRGTLDRHVIPALGKIPLNRLDHLAVQGWVKRLERDGLQPATVRSIFRVLSAVLASAVRDGRITESPARNIDLPAMPPPADFHWSRDEIDLLLAELDGQDRALVEVLVGTGMRWGEAAGLHVGRLDLLRRRLTVAEVLEEDGGLRLKAYPKSRKTRQVPLDPDLREVLGRHIGEQPPLAPCGLDHGKARCSGLLFHNDGRPLSRHSWPRQVFEPALKAAGVRRGRIHDLRHTAASWWVADGVDLYLVQQLLGHSSVKVTERYSHLAPDALDNAKLLASLAKGRARREPLREPGP